MSDLDFTARWLVTQCGDGSVHCDPIGDLIEHEHMDGCVCGPRTEAVKRKDGSVGWMYVHSSLDGREQSE